MWGLVIPVLLGRGAAVGVWVLQTASLLVPSPAGRRYQIFGRVFSPALDWVPITRRIQAGPCPAAPHVLKHHP